MQPAEPTKAGSLAAVVCNAAAGILGAVGGGLTVAGVEVAEDAARFCSCNLVLTTQIGFVAVPVIMPAVAAAAR